MVVVVSVDRSRTPVTPLPPATSWPRPASLSPDAAPRKVWRLGLGRPCSIPWRRGRARADPACRVAAPARRRQPRPRAPWRAGSGRAGAKGAWCSCPDMAMLARAGKGNKRGQPGAAHRGQVQSEPLPGCPSLRLLWVALARSRHASGVQTLGEPAVPNLSKRVLDAAKPRDKDCRARDPAVRIGLRSLHRGPSAATGGADRPGGGRRSRRGPGRPRSRGRREPRRRSLDRGAATARSAAEPSGSLAKPVPPLPSISSMGATLSSAVAVVPRRPAPANRPCTDDRR